jgi:hypothetical protein
MTDSRELARHDARDGSLAHSQPQSESARLLQMVLDAAKDPNIDAGKMEQMVKLTTTLQDRERESQFNRDKNAAIMEMPVVTKEGLIVIRDKVTNVVTRTQGRFAKWEDIDRVTRPILSRHNLALAFDVAERSTGGVLVTPILTHANGYTERGSAMPVPADTSGSKNAAQAIGSAVAYGKRYTGCAMLNIVTEGVDDDGNGGGGQIVSLTYERQELVLADARRAFADGNYAEWFATKATPKDRAWLMASGYHADEFGGKALPTPVSPEPVVIDRQRAASPPPPPPPPQPPAERRRASPREWTDGFKEAVQAIRNEDELDLFADEKRELLDRLRSSNQTLWQEAQDAIRDQREAIVEGRLV